jgi:hypothetical protein
MNAINMLTWQMGMDNSHPRYQFHDELTIVFGPRNVEVKIACTCHPCNCKTKFMISSTFIIAFPCKACSISWISMCVWVVHSSNLFSIDCSSCLTPKMIMLSIDLILKQHPCYIIDMMFQVVWNFGWILVKMIHYKKFVLRLN